MNIKNSISELLHNECIEQQHIAKTTQLLKLLTKANKDIEVYDGADGDFMSNYSWRYFLFARDRKYPKCPADDLSGYVRTIEDVKAAILKSIKHETKYPYDIIALDTKTNKVLKYDFAVKFQN